ncbi:leucine-rich repeat protein [Treponema sp. Marseille-Q4523]|uniref:leucine-rich repeat protein n=1 Tax=Treponema sp. Marseille-Q4523 TaxID=2810610 RepID=UPI001960F786|nr:leucine-rich repeat protein [Treponema sp. Marseille-Q4523]MBM7023333.1 leucine-rich repeat protein [Treponema sp. Marseille-Q4523]
MERYEYGSGNIGAAIKLYSTDGRKFNQIYKFDLYANTAPVLEYAGIGKTTVGTDDYYVLLFRAKDMGTTIGGQSVHKDINTMNVTAGGVLSEIPLSFNTGKTDFTTGGDLLAATAVSQLDAAHPLPTDNYWLLRLKTDVKIGGPEKVYDVSIKDTQGLSSEVIRASTQKNKLSDVELFDGLIGITGTTYINPKVFEGMSGKTLTAKAAPAGAAITGKVEKQNSYGSWTETDTVSGTTTAAINLPALGTGETPVLYKITLKAQLSGYDDSNSKDFFVRLVRQEVPVLKLVQNFNGTPYEKNISTAADGYVTEDIIPDAGNYNNSTNALVIYNSNNKAEFEIAPRAGSGAAVKYKLDGGTVVQPTATPARIQLTGTGPYELEVWAENGGWPGPHATVHIKVVNAVSNYTQLKNVVKNAPAGNEIQINIGGNLTAPSGDTEIAVSDGKNLKLIPSSGGTNTINANENGRIFKISGSGTVLNLEDIKLEGGNASTGGAVYVEAGGILKLTGKTVITPSTGADINTKGKNDVYLANGAKIKLDDALQSPEPIVARITPSYIDGSTVLTGGMVTTEYTKFSVTQRDDGFLWTIKNDGTLKAIPTTINGGSGAWKKLKDAVQNLPEGSTITIDGEINATAGSGSNANNGVIDINKNLTIQGKTGAASDILNANRDNLSSNAHPIFRVSGGKTLTLKNLTLKGGKGISGTFGGAINVTVGGTTAELTDCVIEDCTADKGGAIGCGTGTTVKLTRTTIKNCKATNSSVGNGGGIFASGATVEMTGCTLTNNEASVYGGGIYVTDGSLTLTNTTIGGEQFYDGTDSGKTKGNKAKSGGGVYIEGNGTSVTMNGGSIQYNKTIDGYGGGGVCIKGSGISFTMNGGKITQCKADVTLSSSNKGRGGGICVDYAPSPINITIKGSAEISHNESTCQGTASGGGIYGGINSIITVSENATIKNNKAKGFGGGVYFKGTFKFTGGTITENTASSGAGIFSENSSTTLEMSGNARVANDNDIYLPNSRVITITGPLSQNPAARITPETYGTTTQVLDKLGTGVTLANETYKFAVTPQSPAQEWTVGGNGYLKQGRYTEVPYGQLGTYLANNASSTEVNYIEVTGISAAAFVGSYGSPPNPGELGERLKKDPSKKVALKLPSGLSGVTNMDSCFAHCKNLVSLENLPSGVTNMRACFYDCKNLTTVPAIPASVTRMNDCFRFCSSLTRAINIPAGVYDMTSCFQNCKKLQSVKMNCPYIGGNFNGAFSGCDALPNGGIQVPSAQLGTYMANATAMGTTPAKFSAIP